MVFIIALYLERNAYLQWPGSWLGWMGVLSYIGGLGYMAWKFRAYGKQWDVREWAIFGVLFVTELVVTLFIGIRLPPGQALPAPGSLQSAVGPALMIFAALPWVMASGLLGTLASMGLAMLSGLLLALLDTHLVFTIFEYGLMGLLMGIMVNQMYRTKFFQVLRHPVVASIGILLVYPGLYITGVLLGLEGEMPVVLDFALTYVGPITMVVAVTVLLGSLFGEVLVFGLPTYWGRRGTLLPSPGETSLEIRSFYVLGVAVFLMVGVLGIVGWNVATRSARALLKDRMRGAAETSAENVPLAVEVGQNLIMQFAAEEQAAQLTDKALAGWLEGNVRLFPYFRDLMILGSDGTLRASTAANGGELTLQERAGVALALQGVPFQFYVLDTGLENNSAELAFIARVATSGREVGEQRVLLGRTVLSENPFVLNIISSLDSVKAFEGEGFLVDEQGIILYHPDPARVMTVYRGPLSDDSLIDDITSPTGTRDLFYALPVKGRAWTVVVTVPAQEAQRQALQIAVPLLGLLLVLAVVLMGVMRVVLRLVTGSLKALAAEANRIASNKDELATPLHVGGVDEIGQMREAFEQMRASLKAYLDEREQNLVMAKIGEERLSAIIESTPDPVLVTDGNNRLLLANSVAQQVFGNGKPLGEGIPIEEVITQQEIVEMLGVAEDEILTREITLADGRVYVAKAKSVMTEDKRRMGQVCVLRDVTRFKELDTLKSDFVSTVSHDLRSPLTLMRGYATMVQMMGPLNEEQVKYLHRIEHGVDRMGHMVNNLLDLGRIETGVGLKLESVAILDVVKQAVGSQHYQAEQKRIQLEAHYPTKAIPLLQADSSLLTQAINNLIENAIKYTEPGGKVQVSVEVPTHESSILLVVRDTGIGISPVDQIRLFEKFYRVPNKKAQAQRGSGLGLAIVKSVVEQHKGRIWVQSELDKGTAFFIKLPIEQSLNE
ncbi:MAG TPA: ATP-binding protein [Anaerolineales bacterium]|nr:ATP-binding protein [Anaerolineales bacterium]